MADAESFDELEPLFDYHRVQPANFICLDDDDEDSTPVVSPKKRKISVTDVDKIDKKKGKEIVIDDSELDDEDWLLPPPKVSVDDDTWRPSEDSTMKALRLTKQELAASQAQSAQDVVRGVEESVKRDLSGSLESPLETVADKPSKPHGQRAKIVISVQDKDGQKQFRVYKDDKFERLFKMYADKVKLDLQSLAFSFDGKRIDPTQTPKGLDLEDEDMIEVNVI